MRIKILKGKTWGMKKLAKNEIRLSSINKLYEIAVYNKQWKEG
jgi:hypothetical protein